MVFKAICIKYGIPSDPITLEEGQEEDFLFSQRTIWDEIYIHNEHDIVCQSVDGIVDFNSKNI